MNGRVWSFIGFGFSCCIVALGQGVPYSPATLQLTADNTQASQVPAHSSSTLLAFTVEGDTTGGNSFDVVTTDPGVVVSLILPSSVEVTIANAASLGFTFTVIANGSLSEVEIPSVLSLPGTHTVIQIPGGQSSGVYQIKANASNVGVTSGIAATYFSSSTVGVTATTDAANYSIGGTAVLSGLVFDGATPVTGATVTAAISTPVSLDSQATVGNLQLVSQQAVNPSLTDYSYSAALTNTGVAAQSVTAQAKTAALPSGITVLNDTLVFGSVPATSSVTSLNTITIERNPNQSFDPATLQWNAAAPGTPVNVSLTDSGTGFDAAAGDGIYTGTFTPASAGTYTALLSFMGTSIAGNSFSRTTATQFDVSQQLASFSSFTDTQQSGGVTVTATVNVQSAGTYRFTMQLQASNQNLVQGGALVNLATGSQQIAVAFSNSDMFSLGANGPYELVNALLVSVGSSSYLIADSRLDAGPTAAYALSSFAPPLSFTGQNSATGVITGAGPTFDLLRVQIGVNNNSGVQTCLWSATLTDALGNPITSSSASGTVASGNTSVTLDFSGLRIAAVGTVTYPYTVMGASVICGTSEVSSANLFAASGFSASQFTSVTPAFTLSVTGSTPSGPAGSSFAFPLSLTAVGGFADEVLFSVTGLPTGAAGSFSVPSIFGSGFSTLTVTTPANLAAGTYPFTVGYASATVSKTLPLTLTITAVSVQVTVGTNINGPTVSVDGGTAFTGSQVFTWTIGSSHSVSTSTPQSGGTGIQYVWLNWSDSGALTHNVTASSGTISYTSNFKTQFQLTALVNPNATEGSISPATGFFDSGSSVPVTATANTGYVFMGFTGGLTGTTNPQSITMSGPATVTANFQPGPTSLGGSFGTKSGPQNARVLTVNIGNNGPGVALGAQVTTFTLQQTSGAACTPVVTTTLPASAGDIGPHATGQTNVTINFTGCPTNAFFTITASLSANSGAAAGQIKRTNQLQ